jgi:hypothetical protein
MDLLQILPAVSAVLGILAGVLGVAAGPAGGQSAANPVLGADPTPPDANAPEHVDSLYAIVAELRSLLTDERRELSALRELSSAGTKETVLLAERLAGTVLDAELRLTAGVVQAERALRYPTSAATRAAEATLRVERSLSRTENALRQLPDATAAATAAAATLQHEAVELAKIGHRVAQTLRDDGDAQVEARPAHPFLEKEVAALRAAGQEMTSSAREAIASLSQAAQSTVGRLTTAVVAAVEAQHDVMNCPVMVEGFPDFAVSMQEAVSALQREALALSMLAQQIAAQPVVAHERGATDVAASAIIEALTRAQRSTSAIEDVARNVSAASEDVALQIGRLTGIASHAETQAAVLPAIAAQLAEVTGRIEASALPLEVVSTCLPDVASRIEAALPKLSELDHIYSRFESRFADLSSPYKPERVSDKIFERLTDLSVNLVEAVAKIEASIGTHGATGEAVLCALTGLQEAVSAVADHTKMARQEAPTTVQQLATVVRETETLLHQTESLAEAALARRAPAHLLWPAERTATLLAGVEATIGRLRSVATALALTSDVTQLKGALMEQQT